MTDRFAVRTQAMTVWTKPKEVKLGDSDWERLPIYVQREFIRLVEEAKRETR